ncbi:MAG TPA: ABC transporter permease [Candidatus Methylomirabilis sp.]|nr:ABC transporter permease [Candidatus Methylomirabilis sp.]
MKAWASLRAVLFAWFRRSDVDAEMDEELRAHIERRAEDLERSGMARAEAERRARIEFGGGEKYKEECREAMGTRFFDALIQDVRFGSRTLRKSPGFTLVAVLTIALGIGANTAIFSVVDWLILRPLPVKDPGQLAYLVVQHSDGGYENGFSYPNFEDIRKETTSVFSFVAGVEPFQMDGMSVDGNNTPIWTNYVTGDFFELLGIRPALGRFILPSEGRVAGADPVLVISYSFWQTRFGGDANIIGKKVSINGHPVTIVGVAPKGFHGALAILDTQGYLPLAMAATNLVNKGDFLVNRQDGVDLILIARRKPGISLAGARPVLDVAAKRIAQQYPQIDNWKSMRASALGAAPPSADPSNPLGVIAGIFLVLAGLVLLLACMNIANLLLVRAGVRGREMAVRAALGAARTRLLRQMFTESILLAVLGGAGGIALGFLASRAFGAINLGSAIPVVLDFQFSWHVFAYAIGAALLTGVAVGVAPALRASRVNLNEVLHQGGRTATGGNQGMRAALVVAEVSGSLVLLIVAGLFARSLSMVQHVDLGFDASHVLNLSMDPHEAGYTDVRGGQFFQDVLARVRNVPGVQSASIAASVPMGLYSYGDGLKIDGYQPAKDQPPAAAGYNSVSPDYFETMHIPLLRGRKFLASDDQNAPRVAIINEAMANRYWPNQNPIGRNFVMDTDSGHAVQVVGIVKDSRTGSISDTIGPYLYVPFAQRYMKLATLQIRTAAGDTAGMSPTILGVIRSVEPAMPVFDVQTMRVALDTPNGTLLYEMGAGLAGGLGVLGLVLAMIGVYGVVSYSAAQRTQEIGIRVALGARPSEIVTMVLRQGLVIIALGVTIGVTLAAATSQLMSDLLVGVRPLDPLTYGGASLFLALIALAASYVPARRAMKVDPLVALRYE